MSSKKERDPSEEEPIESWPRARRFLEDLVLFITVGVAIVAVLCFISNADRR